MANGQSFIRKSQRPTHVSKGQMMVLEAGQGVHLNGEQLNELITYAPEWVGIAKQPAPDKGADTWLVHIKDMRTNPQYRAAVGLPPLGSDV